MNITRRHQQTSGGLLVPNIRFSERSCSCQICSRPDWLQRVVAFVRGALSVETGRPFTLGGTRPAQVARRPLLRR